MIFEHSGRMMACDVSNGNVETLQHFPADADAYAGNREYHGYSASFVVAAAREKQGCGIDLTCVNVATGSTVAPFPFIVDGNDVRCLDVTGTCVTLVTDTTIMLLDPHTNHCWLFPLPIHAITATAWRLSVGCYVGDCHGAVYSASADGIRFVGTTPPQLQKLYALGDGSCLANTATHVSVLFNNGRCVDFKRE